MNKEFVGFIKQLSELVGPRTWKTIEAEQIVKMGYPEEDILNYTDVHPPRLIVMGTKDPKKETGIMGSTTAGVIYKAGVPVLVIPEKAPLLNLASVKKVVYATNFDEKDFSAIERLLGLLQPFNTEVICLHIAGKDNHELNSARLKNLEKMLKKNFKDAPLGCQMAEGDDMLDELEKYIHENGVDILSLTTHKRNMITRIFNPSIARKMVFHLKIPLLVFHA